MRILKLVAKWTGIVLLTILVVTAVGFEAYIDIQTKRATLDFLERENAQ